LNDGARRARYLDGEPRAAAKRRLQHDLAIEHAGDALDDRQAEPNAARHAGALVEPVKLLEHRAPPRLRNTDAGVADVDAQPRTAAPAADQHAAGRRVFDGVRDEVLEEAPEQPAVGANGQRAGHDEKLEALLARERGELDGEPLQQ